MSAPHLPGYTFVEHLGSGGFADVYLYEQEWPRQRVAVKVVRPDIPVTDREKQLFAAEANAMAKLADHPYIVSVLTAGVTGDTGRPYLVMRYCPPPDLGVRVRSHPMSVPDAISTGIKLASAIETAHRSGILHRDIKPSNVLVTSYHQPALTDFGIAGHVQEVDADSDVRVSYPWSPPELLDGRSNGSVASDVYSLGATIWHVLVGRSPFSVPHGDNSTRALSARILHASPPATQRPDVPAQLDRLLQQCLAKQPAQRPSSALELARLLQQVEASCGFPRTQIAVEGDRPEVATPVRDDLDEQSTAMRPVRVVAATGPRTVLPEVSPADDEPAGATSHRRGAAVWAGLAVVGVGCASALALGAGAGPDPDGRTTPTTSLTPTPGDLDPGALTTPPDVSVQRTGNEVTVTWTTTGPVVPGDRWRWERVDVGPEPVGWLDAEERTITLPAAANVCVRVVQWRNGASSPPGSDCG